jgi:hypothetical protein
MKQKDYLDLDSFHLLILPTFQWKIPLIIVTIVLLTTKSPLDRIVLVYAMEYQTHFPSQQSNILSYLQLIYRVHRIWPIMFPYFYIHAKENIHSTIDYLFLPIVPYNNEEVSIEGN